jgi:hypothetical protein
MIDSAMGMPMGSIPFLIKRSPTGDKLTTPIIIQVYHDQNPPEFPCGCKETFIVVAESLPVTLRQKLMCSHCGEEQIAVICGCCGSLIMN